MFWLFMFLASVAGTLILIGHYERRITAMEMNPRERIRIVPRTYYEEQTGVNWIADGGPGPHDPKTLAAMKADVPESF